MRGNPAPLSPLCGVLHGGLCGRVLAGLSFLVAPGGPTGVLAGRVRAGGRGRERVLPRHLRCSLSRGVARVDLLLLVRSRVVLSGEDLKLGQRVDLRVQVLEDVEHHGQRVALVHGRQHSEGLGHVLGALGQVARRHQRRLHFGLERSDSCGLCVGLPLVTGAGAAGLGTGAAGLVVVGSGHGEVVRVHLAAGPQAGAELDGVRIHVLAGVLLLGLAPRRVLLQVEAEEAHLDLEHGPLALQRGLELRRGAVASQVGGGRRAEEAVEHLQRAAGQHPQLRHEHPLQRQQVARDPLVQLASWVARPRRVGVERGIELVEEALQLLHLVRVPALQQQLFELDDAVAHFSRQGARVARTLAQDARSVE
eukprot:scaffold8179_cov248-Pinguiococcus_pyrenoidosus.AAC.1